MGTTYTITTDEFERMKLLALLKSQHLGRTRAVKKRDLLREFYGSFERRVICQKLNR